MIAEVPADTLSEEARAGLTLFDTVICPKLTPDDNGKFVAIDLDSEDFEVDADDYAATHRLRLRQPAARMWLFRAGHDATYRLRHSRLTGKQ